MLAIIGAIVGEYLGGNQGLGRMLIERMNAFEMDEMFAILIHLSLVGFMLYFAVGALRRVLIPWHASGEGSACHLTAAAIRKPSIIDDLSRCAASLHGPHRSPATGPGVHAVWRVLLAHPRPVAIGLRKDLLGRHRPAAAVVVLETLRPGAIGQHVVQRLRQREGVVDSPVQPHAAGAVS